MSKNKIWICETTAIAYKTILVEAKSRKEALEKLKNYDGEEINTNYGNTRSFRVIRQDKGIINE